ncbi:MAG: hypothetical protein LC792_29095 [Actinobacteria bacterium]|nr:hypothetical protein [Actinomycetota bacterium]
MAGPDPEQVAAWAREELGLDPSAAVAVTEKPGTDPRCSPIVTELVVEAPGESPFTVHIERPLAEVTQMDVLAAIAFGGH